MDAGSTRTTIVFGLACALAGAFCTSSARPPAEDGSPVPVPAASAWIGASVDRLVPACRPVAQRALRHAIDQSRRNWLSEEDVRRLLAPLERGGATACETIADQRFALGEI